MSNICLGTLTPFVCVAILSFLVGAFSTKYLFPRIAGFKIGLIYAGYQFLFNTSTSFPLQCLLMYFIGALFRARIARQQALPLSNLILLFVLVLLAYASAGLSVSYDIETDDGTSFRPVLELGTDWGEQLCCLWPASLVGDAGLFCLWLLGVW